LRFTDFDVGPWPRLAINSSRDTLYYLKNDLYQLPISSNDLPSTPLVPATDRTFYGLGLRPSNGHLFLADAIDYQQKGQILEYNAQGDLLNTFEAGVIPNGFYFY
ncbi:MAG: YncE family protein, partial [Bacteroidota bacterium]